MIIFVILRHMASNNYMENDWIDRSWGDERIFSTVTPRVLMVEPNGYVPIRTYPDAAMALIHLEKMRRKGARAPITPEWLNVWGEVIFLLSPHRRYIKGAPPLEELGLAHRPPRIPKNYPPEIKRWLSRQYRKM